MVAALAVLLLLLVPNWTTAMEVVVPNAQTSTVGNSAENEPFGCDHIFRYQQAYRGSELGAGPISISEMAFRLRPGQRGSAKYQGAVRLKLSSSTRSPDQMSTTFADNVGEDERTVFIGNAVLQSAGTGPAPPTPRPFELSLRF